MRTPSTFGQAQPACPHTRGVTTTATAALIVTVAAIVVSAAFSGAIYTSLGDGTVVNQNLYDSKDDVYLNGGPQGQSPKGLPDGTYYFQVTNPSGAVLLSTDNAECRQLQVTGGVVSGSIGPACKHANGSFNPANSSTPVQLTPFADTPNTGGEYKVWLVPTGSATIDAGDPRVLIFSGGNSKTDNFKVDQDGGPSPTENEISGTKFYDANVNGVRDDPSDEPGIPGWKIEISIPSNTTTDASGNYVFLDVPDGTYDVCEVIPELSPVWIPTTPTSIAGIAVPPDSTGNDFGNVCLGPGGGKTLGYWSNKNGANVMSSGGGLAIVNALPLVDGAGAYVPDFATHGAFRTWILGASATNMAYMLSAQLAAMKLNATIGDVEGSALLYAGSCGNTGIDDSFITVNDLIQASINELTMHPLTLSGSPYRAYQQCLKDTLDNGNNNRNFVQETACEVNYSGLETSCLVP